MQKLDCSHYQEKWLSYHADIKNKRQLKLSLREFDSMDNKDSN